MIQVFTSAPHRPRPIPARRLHPTILLPNLQQLDLPISFINSFGNYSGGRYDFKAEENRSGFERSIVVLLKSSCQIKFRLLQPAFKVS
jgi:hypothetical protein